MNALPQKFHSFLARPVYTHTVLPPLRQRINNLAYVNLTKSHERRSCRRLKKANQLLQMGVATAVGSEGGGQDHSPGMEMGCGVLSGRASIGVTCVVLGSLSLSL